MSKVKRNYKDTVFRMLFREKEQLLSLYNAVNGTHYTNADDLEVNTLENAVYMNMKNDVSFVFDLSLNLYEHQSTWNPNMPLRNLFYVSKVLQNMVKDKNLYSSTRIRFPTPRFVVFYNGMEKYPARRTEYLSAAFEKPTDEPELELAVTVINLNCENEELLTACNLLKEYKIFVEKVRKNALLSPIEDAVTEAVEECIREGILADFLAKNRAEVVEVSIFEYDEEKHMRFVREEGFAEGKEEGKEEGEQRGKAGAVLELLRGLGSVPKELVQTIMEEKNTETLSKWLLLAAKANNIKEFMSNM